MPRGERKKCPGPSQRQGLYHHLPFKGQGLTTGPLFEASPCVWTLLFFLLLHCICHLSAVGGSSSLPQSSCLDLGYQPLPFSLLQGCKMDLGAT